MPTTTKNSEVPRVKRTNAKAAIQIGICRRCGVHQIEFRTNPGICCLCRTEGRKAATARYRAKNRETLKAVGRAYFKINRERYSLNRELRRANDPQTDKVTRQAWYRNNRERWKIYEATRRALERGSTGLFTPDDMKRILVNQQFKCFYCGCDVSGDKHTADHYIPLNRGGSNWPENIVAACRPCNIGKCDMLPDEYIESRIRRGKAVADPLLLGARRQSVR